LRFALPRSSAQALTLLFALLAGATLLGVLAGSVLNGTTPGQSLAWVGVLLALAVCARLYPYWRHELDVMTVDRARVGIGAALFVFIALSISWHLVAGAVGLDTGYLLLGPLSRGAGAVAALGVVGLTAAVLVFRVPIVPPVRAVVRRLSGMKHQAAERHTVAVVSMQDLALADEEPAQDVMAEAPAAAKSRATRASPTEPVPTVPAVEAPAGLPPIDIFAAPVKTATARIDLDHVSQRIQECLESFNVAARVVGHHSGPVITQFDIQPERGVKVKSITALQNDLALALAAPTIRIQAPVPGKPVVGIEIPNTSATTVTIRELLESDAYRATRSPLRVPLGKDVAGAAQVIDLARMPHLLIAGATGSGKSACVNSLISSLLYQNTPEQVRLMMIDPKMVELTVYNGVPHLLSPVVTQMDKVVGVLQWAIREMERRYKLFSETMVRNVTRFNEKAESLGLKKLPYIVLIVDELADLMMVAPEDVEDAICRLAQLARAAGIHLVIATQRPSVDVVTGLIKANFPARIAFAMTSQVDSRTILDTVGAEKLLGRGDMLYMPPDAPRTMRLQGAFVGDAEIERLVEFWQKHPIGSTVPRIAEDEFAEAAKASASADDDLLGDATRVVREYRHASVSLLQRRLKVGYARAARIMDQLEAKGVVGPADGSKQRQVLDGDAD